MLLHENTNNMLVCLFFTLHLYSEIPGADVVVS